MFPQLLYKMTKLEEKYADELKELKQKYDTVLNQYKQKTETKQAHFKILAEKDDCDSLQIINHFEEIASYTQRIHQTKAELDEMESKHRSEIQNLEQEKNEISKQLLKSQKQNNQNMVQDQTRLKVLVNVSNNLIKVSKKGSKNSKRKKHLIISTSICRI